MIRDALLVSGFKTLLGIKGRQLKALNTAGQTFVALMAVAPPLDPETPLGSDPREKVAVEVLEPGPVLALNDYVIEVNTPNKWQALYRENNPADFTVKYIMAKVTTLDS